MKNVLDVPSLLHIQCALFNQWVDQCRNLSAEMIKNQISVCGTRFLQMYCPELTRRDFFLIGVRCLCELLGNRPTCLLSYENCPIRACGKDPSSSILELADSYPNPTGFCPRVLLDLHKFVTVAMVLHEDKLAAMDTATDHIAKLKGMVAISANFSARVTLLFRSNVTLRTWASDML